MKRIEIRYAGVDLTGYPPHLDKLIREGRYNFFEVPWNCSCPGYGNVIVTSEQLSRIRAFPQIEENGADLELLVFNDEGQITAESAVLHFILPIRAVPIWGEHFRHSEIDEDGFPSLGSVFDTEANSEGLWSLELQDRRTKLISDYWIPPNAGAFNVQDTPFDGTKFLDTTAQSETVAWKTKEIIDRITDASVVFTFEDGNFDTLPKVYDVFVAGIPSLIAVDLLLNATITPHVFRFDPTQPLAPVFNLVSLTKSIEPLVSAYAPLRLFGGGEIIFRQYRYPAGMPVWRNRGGVAADFSDYYTSAAVPELTSETTPYVRHTKSTSIGGIAYRDRQPYHAIYSGFCSGFLSHLYPVSLVIFNWANHVPTTEVYVGRQSPVRTLLDGPTGHFLRDVPLRVSINGDIGLPELGGGAAGFKGVIVKCNHQDGLARVNPVGSPPNVEITVDLGVYGYHQAGDLVNCSPIGKGWVIVTQIPFRYNPPTGAVPVSGTQRNVCTDTI